jgi:hypothetical protein
MPIWDQLPVPPPLPPSPIILKSWHKNPHPCQPYKIRHTCTLSNTQLHNPDSASTCSPVRIAASMTLESGGRMTWGGPGLPRNVHALSEYQLLMTSLSCTKWPIPKYNPEMINVKKHKYPLNNQSNNPSQMNTLCFVIDAVFTSPYNKDVLNPHPS